MVKKKDNSNKGFWKFIRTQVFLIILVLLGIGYYLGKDEIAKVRSLYILAETQVKSSSAKTFRQFQTSQVYDNKGELISVIKGEKDVYYLESQNIPLHVKNAFISIEDKKFYEHKGIDFRAIVRSLKSIIENQEITQGASTITMQLSRNIFLTNQVTWERKVEEIFIARELEERYIKEDILEFYINNIYFANGYYGIQAASKGYFDTEVTNLSLSQIAFLCGIPNNPTIYDPRQNFDNTIKRRNLILSEMLEDGKISNTEYEQAVEEEITLQKREIVKNNYVETYIYNSATRILMEQEGFKFQYDFSSLKEQEEYEEKYQSAYGECQKRLFVNGYRIETSIDLDIQERLQSAVDNNLKEFTTVNEEGTYELQGAATCIDNHTGLVVAIVGGRSQEVSGYTLNRAYQSYRQPGSAIKPLIVYGPVLDRGYTPDSVVNDQRVMEGPENANATYEGEISLRTAVEKSKNVVAWDLFQELTPSAGLKYLKVMGFSKISSRDQVPAASLGGFTYGVTTVEMASAYSALENYGYFRTPTCITKIESPEGKVLYERENKEISVYKESSAVMMTDMLKGVITNGTGKGLGLEGIEAAGKTGTTNENKDGWFVGYTKYYTTSVWTGYDIPKTLKGLSGYTYPGQIWKDFMTDIHTDIIE